MGSEMCIRDSVGSFPILDDIGALLHQEQAVNAILAEAMAASFKLVIMHDADQGMQDRSAHIIGVVIDVLYLEDLFHAANLQISVKMVK